MARLGYLVGLMAGDPNFIYSEFSQAGGFKD